LGRKYCGDAVCAPLAGVFADIVLAVEDFERRKLHDDPLVRGKHRLLVFDVKGTGPCRQGQYYEQHKLLSHKLFSGNGSGEALKLLVSRESAGYNIGVEEWAVVQVYQGFIVTGVLQSLLMKGSRCRDHEEYERFYADYLQMKEEVIASLERSRPSALKLAAARLAGKAGLGAIGKYLAYGLYNNNGLRKILRDFSAKWVRNGRTKINIYIEGEAYMRGAQFEEIFELTVDAIGFGSFEMDYSPLWLYLELLAEYEILARTERIDLLKWTKPDDPGIQKGLREIDAIRGLIRQFRSVMVEPLYQAAGLKPPDTMRKILRTTKDLLPNIKPAGELPAYVGEAIQKARNGTDLFLNVAPEGCMVSSMGTALGLPIRNLTNTRTQLQGLFSLNGEVDNDSLRLAILKTLGPEKYYSPV
jgi:hypothetical protein